MRDLYHNLLPVSSLAPAVRTADLDGTSVDLQGYDSCMVVMDIGARGVAFTNTNHLNVRLEHSDDNTHWADVVAADVQRAATGDVTAGAVHRVPNGNANDVGGVTTVGYIGDKRYLRSALDYVGSHSTGTSVGIVMVLGNASYRPVV